MRHSDSYSEKLLYNYLIAVSAVFLRYKLFMSPFEFTGSQTVETHTGRLRRLLEAYSERYSACLDAFCDRANSTLDDLYAVFWEGGIIDRLSPENHEERVARRSLGKDVFEGDKDAPELFWRLLYVCAQVDHVGRSGIGERSTWFSRPVEFTVQKLLNVDHDLFDSLFGTEEDRKNPDEVLLQATRERAIRALELLGEIPHLEYLPIGARGQYAGIPVEIHGYTPDGLVVLHTQDKQDYATLINKNPRRSSAVVACDLDAAAFVG